MLAHTQVYRILSVASELAHSQFPAFEFKYMDTYGCTFIFIYKFVYMCVYAYICIYMHIYAYI